MLQALGHAPLVSIKLSIVLIFRMLSILWVLFGVFVWFFFFLTIKLFAV